MPGQKAELRSKEQAREFIMKCILALPTIIFENKEGLNEAKAILTIVEMQVLDVQVITGKLTH